MVNRQGEEHPFSTLVTQQWSHLPYVALKCQAPAPSVSVSVSVSVEHCGRGPEELSVEAKCAKRGFLEGVVSFRVKPFHIPGQLQHLIVCANTGWAEPPHPCFIIMSQLFS